SSRNRPLGCPRESPRIRSACVHRLAILGVGFEMYVAAGLLEQAQYVPSSPPEVSARTGSIRVSGTPIRVSVPPLHSHA
ncbi:MAG: hypothetical protein ACXWNH_18220, partial [Vulcanimicrobiaceae bacterium]